MRLAILLLCATPAMAQVAPGSATRAPEHFTDEVDLVEGFRTVQEAGRHALDEAWSRAEAASTRADGKTEQEFGGLIYRTDDGRYGYTTPRSNAGPGGVPLPGVTEVNSAREVDPWRGVADINEPFQRLYTPEGEFVRGDYHIHPEIPLDGEGIAPTEGWNFSQHDEARHEDLRMTGASTSFVRGEEGSSMRGPDGVTLPIGEMPPDTEDLPPPEITRRPMVCGPQSAACDDGREEAACIAGSGGLDCKVRTKKPCVSIHRMPAAALSYPACAAALAALSTQPQAEPSSSAGGGLDGALGVLGQRIENIAKGDARPAPAKAGAACGLDRPICVPAD